MQKILFLMLLVSPFLSYTVPETANIYTEKIAARCVGNTPCNACSNCSQCKWCSAGGTCGVCAKPKKTYSTAKPKEETKQKESYSVQCKAITKKGTRCSRASRSNGYCWQHGG